MRLVHLQLRFNVSSRVVFELLGPRLDEVDVGARADECAAGISTVVTSADPVPVQGGGAVRLRGGPFAHDDPVVGVGGVAADIVANRLTMLLRGYQLWNLVDLKIVPLELTQGCNATCSLEKTWYSW